MIASAALIAVVLGGLAWAYLKAAALLGRHLGSISSQLERVADTPEAPFSARLAACEDAIERLPQRWEEFSRAATRAEGRARAIVKDARAELEALGLEHPALEEQARELRIIDGGGGEEEAMPAVHRDVESPAAPVSSWEARARLKKFGY